MLHDPLSDILALVAARSALSTGLIAGGDWAVRVDGHTGWKFNAVLQGHAWLDIEGEAGPVALGAGDCFVLTSGAPFVIGSALALTPVPAALLYANTADGVARLGTGSDFHVLGGKMLFDQADSGLLAEGLPGVIVLRATAPAAAHVAWLLKRLVEELRDARPGQAAMADQLMQMLFIESLRAWLGSEGAGASRHVGWIGALADSRLRAAVQAMHGAPARAWTLAELSGIACMSRSSFAARFKVAVGMAPLEYLQRWRMRLASRDLRKGLASVSAIAASLGYASDSAFSNAFKRVQGMSPLAYRRSHGGASAGQ